MRKTSEDKGQILFTRMQLVNWYGYQNQVLPLGEKGTLFFGVNESGKTVALDAFSYALFGDIRFNAAATNNNEKSDRTISSYTRQNIDTGRDLRPYSDPRYRTLQSYILIEIADGLENSVLCTIITSTQGTNTNTERFVCEGKSLEDLSICEVSPSGSKRYFGPAAFEDKNGFPSMNSREGILSFMDKIGLHFGSGQEGENRLKEFRRKFVEVKAYNPKKKDVDEFLRQQVLPDIPIGTEELIETTKTFRSQKEDIEGIQGDIRRLRSILSVYNRVQNLQDEISVNEIKKVYKQYLGFESAISDAMQTAGQYLLSINAKEDLQEKKKKEGEDLRRERDGVRAQIEALLKDGKDPEVTAAEVLDEREQAVKALKQQVVRIRHFQELVLDMLKDGFGRESAGILENLFGAGEEEKVTALKSLSDELDNALIETRALIREKRNELDSVCDEIAQSAARIREFRKNVNVTPSHKKAERLRDAIRERLARSGRAGHTAELACDLVAGIDEDWRDVIEAYLGSAKYDVIVEPEDYPAAEEVLMKMEPGCGSIVNTYALSRREEIAVRDGSLAEKLLVKNSSAKMFFDLKLGNIIAEEDSEKVKEHTSAISRDGRCCISYSTRRLNLKNIDYAIGPNVAGKNLKAEEKNLGGLKKTKERLEEEILQLKRKLSRITEWAGNYETDGFECERKLEEARESAAKAKAEYEMVKSGHNPVFILKNRESELNDAIKRNSEEISALEEETARARGQRQYFLNKANEEKEKEASCREALSGYEREYPEFLLRARDEYDKFVQKGNENARGGVFSERAERERRNEFLSVKNELSRLQKEYEDLRHRNLPVITALNSSENYSRLSQLDEISGQDRYQSELDRLNADRLPEELAKLDETEKKCLSIIRTDIITKILSAYNAAERDLRQQNERLKTAGFKAQYRFHIKVRETGPEYKTILDYAKKLQMRPYGQLSIDSLTYGREEEGELEDLESQVLKIFRKALNRSVEKGDDKDLNSLCDYREYVSCEAKVIKDGAEISLQDRVSKASGGGTQIPYCLLLISALLVCYDRQPGCARVVLFDEAFSKMDGPNVKAMMEYMEKCSLQPILCAPGKLHEIGDRSGMVTNQVSNRPTGEMYVISTSCR